MKSMGEPHRRTRCTDGVPGCTHYVDENDTSLYPEYLDAWRADRDARDKRLTDTELSAGYWEAKANPRIRAYQRDDSGNIVDVPGTGWEYEHQIWHRFATLPHYTEA